MKAALRYTSYTLLVVTIDGRVAPKPARRVAGDNLFAHCRDRRSSRDSPGRGIDRERKREPRVFKIPIANEDDPQPVAADTIANRGATSMGSMGQIGPNDTHVLLMDAFLQNNRLDHVSRVMSSHPSYLEHFLRTQHFILRGDGPLPYDYRHLIAIMAAGRHQCSYLINLQKGEFVIQGGDPSWLQGLRSMPGKLQDLYEINKILAHRPWLLNKSHIEKLTKGDDNWSLAEVVHAIVLLAHFHSLSSFVFSCGINEELDNVTGHHYKENKDNSSNIPPAKDKLASSPKKIPNGDGKTENNIPSSPSSPSIVGEQEVGVETLMERMKRLSEKSESYQITQEELSKRFETVETQSAELAAAPQRSSSVLDSDIGLFIEDPTFIYQDFAKRGQLNDIPTFRVQDYSWDDHGYSLVNRLYNDVGNLLDDKFKTAYNLTYYTMGTHSKVDTSRFRRAIWNYIQCMFGIRHDDYDYNEVNQLLERSLKTFIKSAVCYPERVTKRDYDRVMREFKHSEKVHVNLMILEARMQAELLYALRAVMRSSTSSEKKAITKGKEKEDADCGWRKTEDRNIWPFSCALGVILRPMALQ
ncbi:Sestrin-like protein [Temnothorax longispinosus]|uniref:Sestrin-like protein n=1 Tax=Temnothorax longispinosus TaxID=300112 RepID=A0A4S2J9E5_9HYME|nr:Sestrin-like protein [Temnothorax longispinosus]